MKNLIVDKNEKKEKFQENINKYNYFFEDYLKIKKLNNDIVLNHEINRNSLLKEIMLKSIGNEISSFKHLILDLEKIHRVKKNYYYEFF